MIEKSVSREHRHMSENPPRNAEINPLRAEGGMVPEIRPVLPLRFVPVKGVRNGVTDKSDYSDDVDTDDKIADAQNQSNIINIKALVNAEKIAAERQKALDQALINDQSLLEERDQYKAEITKYKQKIFKGIEDHISDLLSQNEQSSMLVAGLNSMTKSHKKLQQDMK